ncbi:putative Zinc finger, BED-type [Corchorus capsularis]|uniref:Putative Zinc finger, BED-type n=1 Tax=Corchorus capsularis TaxID=210143 RepID=A0A1R3JYC8_COCAP|nr:putative Zinc finger, BED-type [Corchorus capsularis]
MSEVEPAVDEGKEAPKPLPPRKKCRVKAYCWNHFTKYLDDNNLTRAKCNYCDAHFAAEPKRNGTASLNSHMYDCPYSPLYIAL